VVGFVLLTAAIAVVLAALNWGAIDRVNVEAGDFAANSLQVLQAKTDIITEGHYSRFGFHHPGPVFLYTLAISEIVFFDLLGWVPSAFSAHLMAVAIVNALAIATVTFMLRSLVSRWLMAFSAAAAFIVTLSWMNIQVFNSAWFPYMYALPFAAFITALAVTLRGRAFGLPVAAVFGGFLINGHASFLFIVPSVVLAVLAINILLTRDDRANRIASRAWIGANRSMIFLAAAVFALFLAPFMWRQFRQWPSPIREYLSNGAGGTSRDPLAGVTAFFSNPRGTWVVVITLVALVIVVILAARRKEVTGALTLAWVLLAASLVHALYNLIGVDDPANSYLSFYFLVVPALVPAVLVMTLDRWSSRPRVMAPVALAAGVGLLYAIQVNQTVAWPEDYQRGDVLLLQESIPAGESITVLDLDSTQDWGQVWSAAMGYALAAEREGSTRVCIRENWFVGFTDELRCTETDIAVGNVFRISSNDSAISAVPSRA